MQHWTLGYMPDVIGAGPAGLLTAIFLLQRNFNNRRDDMMGHYHVTLIDARSEPKFWAVGPTEGPLRTRQRLQKAKLGLNPSLVNRAGQYKLGKLNFLVSTSSVS